MPPRVTIIVLGGTITMVPQAGGGIAPTVSGDDLIAAVPQLSKIADISVITPFLVPGASLSFSQVAHVADLVSNAANEGADGVVVVQGTDTIDETSFLFDLTVSKEHKDVAIVVTGAMRGASAPGADGHANILAAVTVAATRSARGKGTLVVLNDEVHSASYVQKMDTGLPSGFLSPGVGPIGTVTEGQFQIRMVPVIPEVEALSLKNVAPVAVVTTGLGDEGQLLDAVADAGFKGMVISAMGAGHVPEQIVDKLTKLVEQMPVVLATRVSGGSVFTGSYGFAGSEIDLIRRGLIPAGILPPHKARQLLACLLGAGSNLQEIKSQFKAFA